MSKENKQLQREISEIKHLRFNKLWTYENIAKKYGHSIYWVHSRLANYKSAHKLKCQKCDSTRRIGFHHIDRNKKNNNPKNLIPLCWKCHQLIESITLNWMDDKDFFKNNINNLHKIIWGFKWKGSSLIYKDSERYIKCGKWKRLTKKSPMYKILFEESVKNKN